MNLLERLKPEFKERLDSQKYPLTYEGIIGSLTENDYYTQLTIGEVVTLFQHLNLDLNISNLNTLFIS
jgi:hypothetical protein